MKKHKLIIIIVISVFIGLLLLFGIYKWFFAKEDSNKLMKYKLTEDVAIQIGKMILIDKFPDVLNEETQFEAVDHKDSWIIKNVVNNYFNEKGEYTIVMGGGYSVEIKKSNCEILDIRIED